MKSLRDHKVAGFMSMWGFYGFTGSIPEEILSEMVWDGDLDANDLLLKIARRDLGDVSEKILEGWRKLGDVWPKIPASHMIYGEREFYMKGPASLGPAHPLIFDAQNRYGLGWKFFTLRGDAVELLPEDDIAELEKNAPPRYSSDLLFVYPFGSEAAEEAFRRAMIEWDAGVKLISEAVGSNPSERAIMELNVCRILGAHLHSIWNVIRFYRTRDAFFGSPGTPESIEEQMRYLTEVIDDEIENAKSILHIIESDFRIGYGHTYGQVYDTEMILEKIRQCEYVRDVEIPDLRSGIIFHVYHKYMPAYGPDSRSSGSQ